MSLPNHDGKHEEPPVVTPDQLLGERSLPEYPDAAVLCYQDEFFEAVVDERATRRLADGFYEAHAVDGPAGELAVVGRFGIGAPVAAMAVENLAHAGVEAVATVGTAGCLQADVGADALLVPERAIRDEGTSHHYLEPGTYAGADPALHGAVADAAAGAGVPDHAGTAWTTDAPYRETVAEVAAYREAGVLGVEMEAAAVFAVAACRGLAAAAVLVVSDYLHPDGWEPLDSAPTARLRRAFDVAVAGLAGGA